MEKPLSFVGPSGARVLVVPLPDAELVALAVDSGSCLFVRMDVHPRTSMVVARASGGAQLPEGSMRDRLGITSEDVMGLEAGIKQWMSNPHLT